MFNLQLLESDRLSLLQYMSKLRHNNILCDAELFPCDSETTIKFHKAVLLYFSPTFQKLYSRCIGSPDKFGLDDFEYGTTHAIQGFLDLLYGDIMLEDVASDKNVMLIAKNYEIDLHDEELNSRLKTILDGLQLDQVGVYFNEDTILENELNSSADHPTPECNDLEQDKMCKTHYLAAVEKFLDEKSITVELGEIENKDQFKNKLIEHPKHDIKSSFRKRKYDTQVDTGLKMREKMDLVEDRAVEMKDNVNEEITRFPPDTSLKVKEYSRKQQTCKESKTSELPFTILPVCMDKEEHRQDKQSGGTVIQDKQTFDRKHGTEYRGPRDCDVCGRTLPSRSAYERHRLTHTKEKPWICTTCGRGFNAKVNLKIHEKTHEKREKKHTCLLCDSTFFDSHSLQNHMRLVHIDEEKRVTCDICGKTLKNEYNLQKHKATLHNDSDLPFKCNECDRNFLNLSGLERHRQLHSGALMYACAECDECFRSAASRDTHVNKIHKQQAFICDVCGNKYNNKFVLKKHISMVHGENKPRKCPHCHKKVANYYSHLKMHRSYDRSEVHTCQMCFKTFPLKVYLHQHMKLHSDPEFKCETCDKKFHFKSGLQSHQRAGHCNQIGGVLGRFQRRKRAQDAGISNESVEETTSQAAVEQHLPSDHIIKLGEAFLKTDGDPNAVTFIVTTGDSQDIHETGNKMNLVENSQDTKTAQLSLSLQQTTAVTAPNVNLSERTRDSILVGEGSFPVLQTSYGPDPCHQQITIQGRHIVPSSVDGEMLNNAAQQSTTKDHNDQTILKSDGQNQIGDVGGLHNDSILGINQVNNEQEILPTTSGIQYGFTQCDAPCFSAQTTSIVDNIPITDDPITNLLPQVPMTKNSSHEVLRSRTFPIDENRGQHITEDDLANLQAKNAAQALLLIEDFVGEHESNSNQVAAQYCYNENNTSSIEGCVGSTNVSMKIETSNTNSNDFQSGNENIVSLAGKSDMNVDRSNSVNEFTSAQNNLSASNQPPFSIDATTLKDTKIVVNGTEISLEQLTSALETARECNEQNEDIQYIIVQNSNS